jgi:rod shape-determining protein MreC
MKIDFYPKRKINIKKRNIYKFLLITITILGLFFSLNFFQKEIKSFFYYFSSPFQKFFWKKAYDVSNFFNYFGNNKKLNNEINQLKDKNKQLESEIAYLRELKNENKALREALNLNLEKDFNLIFAKIISKEINRDFIIIDKGYSDGIFENMPVITYQKSLLGKVVDVYKNYSKVMLFSDKKSIVDVKIQPSKEQDKEQKQEQDNKIEENILGVLKGQGNLKSTIDLVPNDKKISEGDMVITSGLGGTFPSGILIGKIKNVKKSDLEPFQYIEIEPNFDILQLDFIFVIDKK